MNLLKDGEATRDGLVQWALDGEHPVAGLVSVPAGNLMGWSEVVGRLVTYLQEHATEVRQLEERIAGLTTCDCGRSLGRGHCPVCDSDRRME